MSLLEIKAFRPQVLIDLGFLKVIMEMIITAKVDGA